MAFIVVTLMVTSYDCIISRLGCNVNNSRIIPHNYAWK